MLIIHINEWRFQAKSLFSYEVIDGCIMTVLFLQLVRTENAVNDMVGWKR